MSSDAWFKYFRELFTYNEVEVDQTEESIFKEINRNTDREILENEISEDEIMKSLRSLKNSCACGIDEICIEMYKNTIHVTMEYLKSLFNGILKSEIMPSKWCESLITPAFKKGRKSDPNNYRAISVINSLSKIFMKIMSNRLQFWAESNALIDESQAGFRHGYSTIDNMFTLQSVIQKYISKRKGRVYVFFVEFMKAYDNCVHEQLWKSLQRKGLPDDSKFLAVFNPCTPN